MVLISNIKYACETCIKGHRSSSCKHTDRPLFEIKKKGRPVTQCEHCRELRKTKQVHVKCMCESKEDSEKKGHPKALESAVFPQGVPEALETSVTLQPGEGSSSESEHGGDYRCCCKSTSECHCWTPRKSIQQKKRFPVARPSLSHAKDPASSTTPVTVPRPADIVARIAELRPVLPKPPTPERRTHEVTPGVHIGNRHHVHDDHYYSPYGRAYGYSHGDFSGSSESLLRHHAAASPSLAVPLPSRPSEGEGAIPEAVASTWAGDSRGPNSIHQFASVSMCGCGDSCSCPGCLRHNKGLSIPVSSAFSSCTNPDACGTCFDCAIFSLNPIPKPPDVPLSMYDYNQQPAIDQWIRPSSSYSTTGMPLPDTFQSPLYGAPEFVEPLEKGEAFVMPGETSSYQDVLPNGIGFDPSTSDITEKAAISDWGTNPIQTGISSFNVPWQPPGLYLTVPGNFRSRSSSTSSLASHPFLSSENASPEPLTPDHQQLMFAVDLQTSSDAATTIQVTTRHSSPRDTDIGGFSPYL